jgi:hypothetical protein
VTRDVLVYWQTGGVMRKLDARTGKTIYELADWSHGGEVTYWDSLTNQLVNMPIGVSGSGIQQAFPDRNIAGTAGVNSAWTFDSTASVALIAGRFGGQAISGNAGSAVTRTLSRTVPATTTAAAGAALRISGSPTARRSAWPPRTPTSATSSRPTPTQPPRGPPRR